TVKATAILQMGGRYAMDGVTEYLSVSDQALNDYELYADEGILYRRGGWTRGANNIRVDYTAGYSATTMPSDIKLSIMIGTKYIYQRRTEESFGVSSVNIGGLAQTYEGSLPSQVMAIWDSYKRMRI
ncbi:MAG: hypothetical protein ABIG63_04580, partial [Chloroflexota bacterium]